MSTVTTAVTPFHDRSRRRRLMKVIAWLVGIALVVVVLKLLGIDVRGWLQRPLGLAQRRPDRLHRRRARAPDGADDASPGSRATDPARRLSRTQVAVLADRRRLRGRRGDERLPAGEHRHVRDAAHVHGDDPGATFPGVARRRSSSRRSSSRSPGRSSTSTSSSRCRVRSTSARPDRRDHPVADGRDPRRRRVFLIVILARVFWRKLKKLWEKAKQGGAILSQPEGVLHCESFLPSFLSLGRASSA